MGRHRYHGRRAEFNRSETRGFSGFLIFANQRGKFMFNTGNVKVALGIILGIIIFNRVLLGPLTTAGVVK